MKSTVISQSSPRDPFEIARQKFESKQSVLSSSAVPAVNNEPTEIMDINPMLQKMGIDSQNIANNAIGRTQLASRLQAKFGDNYLENPEAYQVLSTFDQRLTQLGQQPNESMNTLIAQSNRTLKAILGV